MSGTALDTAKDHLSTAVESMRDLAPGTVEDAKAKTTELAKAAVAHGQDALTTLDQARPGGHKQTHRGRALVALGAFSLGALAAVYVGRRARQRATDLTEMTDDADFWPAGGAPNTGADITPEQAVEVGPHGEAIHQSDN